jgi:hypothetical protein
MYPKKGVNRFHQQEKPLLKEFLIPLQATQPRKTPMQIVP